MEGRRIEMSKINQYRELGPIGKGKFGEVVKVERLRDKKLFAMKKLMLKPGMEDYEMHNEYF